MQIFSVAQFVAYVNDTFKAIWDPTQVALEGEVSGFRVSSVPVNHNTIGSPSTETFHSGAPRPIEQPQTGGEMLWITLIGAAAGLLWKSREMLRC